VYSKTKTSKASVLFFLFVIIDLNKVN